MVRDEDQRLYERVKDIDNLLNTFLVSVMSNEKSKITFLSLVNAVYPHIISSYRQLDTGIFDDEINEPLEILLSYTAIDFLILLRDNKLLDITKINPVLSEVLADNNRELLEIKRVFETETECNTVEDNIWQLFGKALKKYYSIVIARQKAASNVSDSDRESEESGEGSSSEPAKEVEEQSEVEAKVDPVLVQTTVRAIMSTYDILYKPLFEVHADGILTSVGVITIDEKDLSIKLVSSGKVYAGPLGSGIINEIGLKELYYTKEANFKNCFNKDGSMKVTYIPSFHVRNIYGIYRGNDGKFYQEKNWVKFRAILSSTLTSLIRSLLASSGLKDADLLNFNQSLVRLFTTVIIADQVDFGKVIKLSIKDMSSRPDALLNIGKLMKVQGKLLYMDTSTISVVDSSIGDNEIYSLLVVIDSAAYNGEILFAYKPISQILESGGEISLKKTLLGRDIKGRNVTYNFAEDSAISTVIAAGTRSGKGVLTLNILATFIASGCPTIYVDWKPDMAAALWDLERDVGARILSIDGASGESDGIRPVRDYGTGFNKPKINGLTKLNVIPYLKAFQTMALCAYARVNGYAGMSNKEPKIQFVFDEAEKMNSNFRDLRGQVAKLLKDKGFVPKKGEEPSANYLYVQKLEQFLEAILGASSGFKDTFGAKGNVGAIIIGQHSTPSNWAPRNMQTDPFGYLVANCSMKLLGREASTDNEYSLGDLFKSEYPGKDFRDERGYFTMIKGNRCGKGTNISVIKSYLVLNKADFNPSNPESSGGFTGSLLNNITDEVIRQNVIENDLAPNGVVNEKVGFKGLIEYIGAYQSGFDLKKNLEAGYVEVERLLNALGLVGSDCMYENVEQYFFDCSDKSLFSYDELANLIADKKSIRDLDSGGDNEDDTDGEGDGSGDESEGSFIATSDENTEASSNLGSSETVSEASESSEALDQSADVFRDSSGNEVSLDSLNAYRKQSEGLYNSYLQKHPEVVEHFGLSSNNDATPDVMGEYPSNTGFDMSAMFGMDDLKVTLDSGESFAGEVDAGDLLSGYNPNPPLIGAGVDLSKSDQTDGVSFTATAPDTANATDTPIAFAPVATAPVTNNPAQTPVKPSSAVPNPAAQVNMGDLYTDKQVSGAGRPLSIDEIKSVGSGIYQVVNSTDGKVMFVPIPDMPVSVASESSPSFGFSGPGQRQVMMDASEHPGVVRCTKQNSLQVGLPSYSTIESKASILFKTRFGSNWEFVQRWKVILDGIASQISAGKVSRLFITGSEIQVNNLNLIHSNLIGGNENIGIEDIVNFRLTAKKFKALRKLIIDRDIMDSAQIEYGKHGGAINGLFSDFKNLTTIIVATPGELASITITRAAWEKAKKHGIDTFSPEVQELIEETSYETDLLAYGSSKNPRLKLLSPGVRNRAINTVKNHVDFWGSSAKTGYKSMLENLTNKDSNKINALFNGLGVTLALIGGVTTFLPRMGWNMLFRQGDGSGASLSPD